MAFVRALLTIAIALALPGSAIAGTKDFALQGYALPANKPITVVLMRPAVDVGELQGGGLPEPNADWTEAARTNIEAALRGHFTDKKIDFVVMEQQLATLDERGRKAISSARLELAACEEGQVSAAASAEIIVCAQERERVTQLEAEQFALGPYEKIIADYNNLHEAVVNAILAHKYGYGDSKLPTKKNLFDYTLGPGTDELGYVAEANYGLFMLTYDQFASDSRKAMQVLGGLGCLIGACMIISGGQHIAYVSLVELETGNIVWFNLLRGSKGDVREGEGARKMIDAIMEGMPTRPGERTASAGEDEG